MIRLWNSFWGWYERTYTLNVSIALALFLLQVVHLIWLFGEVIWMRLFGVPLFSMSGMWESLVILIDYTEIPAIISVSLIYVNEVRKGFSWKPVLFFLFLNVQWLHIFWITDEFVVGAFTDHHQVITPYWLAWVAIAIDYLELPVMVDTLSRFVRAVKEKRAGDFLRNELREAD